MDGLTTILARVRAGDLDAFGEVVERFQGVVFAQAYAALGNVHDAEDATQEAFLNAYRNLGDLRELACFPAWLKQITRTACNRTVRGISPQTTRLDATEATNAVAERAQDEVRRADLCDTIVSALRSLSPRNRACTELYYVEGYSVAEIAHLLRIPPGTVKRRLYDARQKLADHITTTAPELAGRERRVSMTKELKGLRWQCSWVSHLGCVKGCLNYLREHGSEAERSSAAANMSTAWLFGGTGHAFIINMHDVVCPSGPTAWHTERLFSIAPDLGYRVDGILSDRSKPDFAAKQEAAWAYVRRCIDRNTPCYGWELKIPEFYTIHGYDDVGYYYSGAMADDGEGPKPWNEVGRSEIGALEIFSVTLCDPAPDAQAVREALEFACEHARSLPKWTYPKYHAGPSGFEAWAKALDGGTANRFGVGYNAEVWTECRGQAIAFLKEAKERLSGKADALFGEAIEAYGTVHAKLRAVRELHPFLGDKSEAETLASPEGAALVREAAQAEKKGLTALGKIVEALAD